MALVVKRRVGESLVARPTEPAASPRAEGAALGDQGRRGVDAAAWRISLTVVQVQPNFAVLQVERTDDVRQVASQKCPGMHFVTPRGEEIVVRIDVRGHSAVVAVDAPPSVLLLRGELEGLTRWVAARPGAA